MNSKKLLILVGLLSIFYGNLPAEAMEEGVKLEALDDGTAQKTIKLEVKKFPVIRKLLNLRDGLKAFNDSKGGQTTTDNALQILTQFTSQKTPLAEDNKGKFDQAKLQIESLPSKEIGATWTVTELDDLKTTISSNTFRNALKGLWEVNVLARKGDTKNPTLKNYDPIKLASAMFGKDNSENFKDFTIGNNSTKNKEAQGTAQKTNTEIVDTILDNETVELERLIAELNATPKANQEEQQKEQNNQATEPVDKLGDVANNEEEIENKEATDESVTGNKEINEEAVVEQNHNLTQPEKAVEDAGNMELEKLGGYIDYQVSCLSILSKAGKNWLYDEVFKEFIDGLDYDSLTCIKFQDAFAAFDATKQKTVVDLVKEKLKFVHDTDVKRVQKAGNNIEELIKLRAPIDFCLQALADNKLWGDLTGLGRYDLLMEYLKIYNRITQ